MGRHKIRLLTLDTSLLFVEILSKRSLSLLVLIEIRIYS